MLLKLLIENYALIDRLEIGFPSGYTVITGETGAGKSILVGALSLILGERADPSVLADSDRKCIVEGILEVSGYGLESFFTANDIDYENHTTIRREISANGKSRAFVNDTPVGLALLKTLGEQLVNIHSQHAVLTLSDPVFQLAVLDDFAGVQPAVSDYRSRFRKLTSMKQELADLTSEEQKAKGDDDYHRFLWDELVKAKLQEGEQQELESRQEILAHAGEIKAGLLGSIRNLSGEETSLLSLLSETIASLSILSGYYNDIKVIVERLQSNQVDIKDILSELQHLEPTVNFDQEEHDRVAARLDLLYRLEQKHAVDSVEELIAVRDALGTRVGETGRLSERLAVLSKQIAAEETALKGAAGAISARRAQAAPKFQKEMTALLVTLGMPSARFRTGLERTEGLTKDGFEKVRYLFSANKGVEPADLSKVASGGELSRLMLSIKSLITQKNLLPTVIFDEIDSGISGEIAGKVGTILKKMSDHMQVIVITHLPQIAGKGDAHLWVYKTEAGKSARSMIRRLTEEERVKEIARLLSDETVTEAALMTARELLKT